MKIIFIFLLVGLLIAGFIFLIPLNSKTIYKYPAGYYCVPKLGVGYFESNQVPSGAILIQSNPDVTQGEYINKLDANFFKMMGCIK